MIYRIWDKKQKKYLKDVVLSPDGSIHIIRFNEELNSLINEFYAKKGDILGGDYADIDYTDWYGINNCCIEKCVGVPDKNGTEIFENDIILTDEAGWCGYVTYENGSFAIVDGKGGYSLAPNWNRCEVIGNRNTNISE